MNKNEQQNLNYNNIQTAIDQTTMVSIMDSAGKIIYVNESFCQQLTYTKDDIHGVQFSELLEGKHLRFHDIRNQLQQGKTWKDISKSNQRNKLPIGMRPQWFHFLIQMAI